MEPTINRLIRENGSFVSVLLAYQEALDGAVRRDGFVGVKAHVAEEWALGLSQYHKERRGAAYRAAVARHPIAYRKVYIAILAATLLQCQEWECPSIFIAGRRVGCGTAPLLTPIRSGWSPLFGSPRSGGPRSCSYTQAIPGSSMRPRLPTRSRTYGSTSGGSRPGSPCALSSAIEI